MHTINDSVDWTEYRTTCRATPSSTVRSNLVRNSYASYTREADLYRTEQTFFATSGPFSVKGGFERTPRTPQPTGLTIPPFSRSQLREAGEVAKHIKLLKYLSLEAKFHFVLVVAETSGVFGPGAHAFLHKLGCCLV